MVVRHKLINERPFRGNKIFEILTKTAAPSPDILFRHSYPAFLDGSLQGWYAIMACRVDLWLKSQPYSLVQWVDVWGVGRPFVGTPKSRHILRKSSCHFLCHVRLCTILHKDVATLTISSISPWLNLLKKLYVAISIEAFSLRNENRGSFSPIFSDDP